MESIHTETIGRYQVKIYQDMDYSNFNNPRDWDNLGEMICFHRRYELGDEHNWDVDELKEFVLQDDVIALPLYLYDHSGISISTSCTYPYDDVWDAGQVGYIYVTKERIRKEYGVKRISQKLLAQVVTILRQEVKTYDSYLRGDVYGYIVEDEDGEHIASCWGFVGEYDYCLQQGIEAAKYEHEQDQVKQKE